MDNKKIIKALNEDLMLELGAIMQYLHHHWTGEGVESQSILPVFETIARDEMKHAEMFAERINFLGGDPTTDIAKIKKGGSLKKMMQDDLEGENIAIKQYKAHIKVCDQLGDSTTRLMLEQILSDEERHADIWETTLGMRKG